MPDFNQSPALLEARAVAPRNIREIETVEIKQADSLFAKRTLEVCFVIDTNASVGNPGDYQNTLLRLKEAMNGINSDLREKYIRIKYSLVLVAPTGRTFATGPGFTTYRKFKAALDSMVVSVSENLVDSYGAIVEAVDRLNWSTPGPSINQQVVLLTDSPNGFLTSGGTVPRIIFITECISVQYGSGDTRYWSLSCTTFPIFLPGELVTVSGFSNPANNGTYMIGSVYGSTIEFLNPDGSPATITYEEDGEEVTITTVATVDLPPGTAPGGDPAAAIAALTAKELTLSWGPAFYDVGLASLVSLTEGTQFVESLVATKALSRAFFVELLSSVPGIIEGLEPIFLVNDNAPLTANLETGELITFDRRNFGLNVAGSGEDGLRTMTLTVDNTDKAVSRYVAEAKKRSAPLEITFRVYLSNDTSGPQNAVPITLYAVDVESKDTLVSAEAKWIDIINAPFPNAYYLKSFFPSIY